LDGDNSFGRKFCVKTVFITGVSGYFGEKFLSFLDTKSEVERIIGVDIKAPGISSAKLEFIRHDVRHDLFPLLKDKDIDCVIHAAYVLPPNHDKDMMEDININGTRNVFDSCERAGIRHILDCSSTTAYGFYEDNPEFLTEESELRGNDDFTYSKNKKELEFFMRAYRQAHPDICLTIIRPCFVVGPGFDNPLARHLQKKIVFLGTTSAPFQYIHEDDLVEMAYRLMKEKKDGIYNLGADGTITFEEMVRLLGNIPVKIPNRILYFLNSIFWNLRLTFLTEFPSPCLNMLQYRWVASNEKVKKELDFTLRYTTRQAFEDFAESVRKKNNRIPGESKRSG
jgi:UDP-glucose 4-epimerase